MEYPSSCERLEDRNVWAADDALIRPDFEPPAPIIQKRSPQVVGRAVQGIESGTSTKLTWTTLLNSDLTLTCQPNDFVITLDVRTTSVALVLA